MQNVINWFEIPVHDLARAVAFYEPVFGVSLRTETMAETAMAVFPHEDPLPGGALIQCAQFTPSAEGCILYLHTDDLAAILQRIATAGGQCLFGPQILPNDIGSIALFTDSEGNRIGLHQPVM